MNNDWKNYLLQNNASLDDNDLLVFNDPYVDSQYTSDDTLVCDLSCFSTLVIAGGDAVEFMQGQFTNDVEKVDDDHSQMSSFCNNKGRMIANFRLFRYQKNYFINLKNSLVNRSIEHLQNYVLRAEVAIQDVSDQLIHLGISGQDTVTLLSPFFDDLNTAVNGVSQNDNYIAIRIAGSAPRYEIFCSFEHARTLWESLADNTHVVNSTYWDYLNIQNGLPFIDNDTSETFVPQMANMELIDGISFEKGCYTGQEIVARTHFLGKQKRRAYRIRIISDTEPGVGDQLATTTSTENQYTGTLVTIYPVAENNYEALAVIQIKSAEENTLKLKDHEAEIILLDLPYQLTERE